jgi:hypothetical protein
MSYWASHSLQPYLSQPGLGQVVQLLPLLGMAFLEPSHLAAQLLILFRQALPLLGQAFHVLDKVAFLVPHPPYVKAQVINLLVLLLHLVLQRLERLFLLFLELVYLALDLAPLLRLSIPLFERSLSCFRVVAYIVF